MKHFVRFFITAAAGAVCALAALVFLIKTGVVDESLLSRLPAGSFPRAERPVTRLLVTLQDAQAVFHSKDVEVDAEPESLPGSIRLDSAVRLSAIRRGTNYGWIELPRGTVVDLVSVEPRSLIVRFDDGFVRIPKWTASDGTVSLRKRSMLKI